MKPSAASEHKHRLGLRAFRRQRPVGPSVLLACMLLLVGSASSARCDDAGHPDYRPPRLAIRDGRWKLLCNFDGSDARLFDIPADPQERSNLAADNAEIVARLKSQVLAWKKTLPAGPVQGAPRSRAAAPPVSRGASPSTNSVERCFRCLPTRSWGRIDRRETPGASQVVSLQLLASIPII